MVRLWRTPHEVHMEVSDEGRGLSEENRAKIASGESAGVGLRGMRERVKQIGGRIGLRSEGKGTSISVTLPLVEKVQDNPAARSRSV